MKIIDLGTNHIANQLCEWGLVEDVITTAEKSIRWNSRNSISPLVKEIPVYLLNEIDMPLLNSEIKSRNLKNFDTEFGSDFELWIHQKNLNKSIARKNLENFRFDNSESSGKELVSEINIPETEYFGFYTRNESPFTQRYKSIYLCPERIFSFTGNRFLNNFILALTTIHLLAHARMESDLSEYFTEEELAFLTFIEEPLATWFTLKYFHSSNALLADFDAAERFISFQPEEYKYGNDIFKANSGENLWQKWALEKTPFFNKEKENIRNSEKNLFMINKVFNELSTKVMK